MTAILDGSARKRVLVIEDEEVDRYLISKFIGTDYQLDFAHSPRQAMLRLVNELYDAILLDINLSDSVTGLELTQFLRNRTRNNGRPVIAMTAHNDLFSEHHASRAGCSAFLRKPLERESLIGAIESVTGSLA